MATCPACPAGRPACVIFCAISAPACAGAARACGAAKNNAQKARAKNRNGPIITLPNGFIKVFKNLNSFKGDSQFSTWLYRIVVNSCKDLLRKSNRQKVVSIDNAYETDDGEMQLEFKDEKLTVVATDGRRLAMVEQEIEFSEDAQTDLVVPSKTVNELIKTLGEEGVLRIRVSATQVAFEILSRIK